MYFLDANTCIHFLKEKSTKLVEALRSKSPQEVKLPAMVVAELLHGAKRHSSPVKSQKIVDAFIAPFEIIPFDTKSAYAYASLKTLLEKRGEIIGPNDLVIAAICLTRKGSILVTNNTCEFSRVPGLLVEDWTK